jgi:hypothetical protein
MVNDPFVRRGLIPGPMNPEEPTSESYREAAERLRELAEQTLVRNIQADLVSLAAYFDRMADHFEAQRRSRQRCKSDGRG